MHILVSWTLHIVRRNCLFARQVTFFFQFHQLIKQKIALVFTSLYWLAYVKISGAKALFLPNFHSAKQTEDPVILKPAQLSRKTAVTSPFFSFQHTNLLSDENFTGELNRLKLSRISLKSDQFLIPVYHVYICPYRRKGVGEDWLLSCKQKKQPGELNFQSHVLQVACLII